MGNTRGSQPALNPDSLVQSTQPTLPVQDVLGHFVQPRSSPDNLRHSYRQRASPNSDTSELINNKLAISTSIPSGTVVDAGPGFPPGQLSLKTIRLAARDNLSQESSGRNKWWRRQ